MSREFSPVAGEALFVHLKFIYYAFCILLLSLPFRNNLNYIILHQKKPIITTLSCSNIHVTVRLCANITVKVMKSIRLQNLQIFVSSLNCDFSGVNWCEELLFPTPSPVHPWPSGCTKSSCYVYHRLVYTAGQTQFCVDFKMAIHLNNLIKFIGNT